MATSGKTTKYTKGRTVEHKVIHFLTESGYHALRSAGSKGAFDVIAFNDKTVRFIQVKHTSDKGTSYAAELRKMASTLVPEWCTKELWVHMDRAQFVKIYTTNHNREYPASASIMNMPLGAKSDE